MKHFFSLLILISSVSLHAQMGVGTTSPDPSAKLDVVSSNKGFLPPRVTLSSATDVTTIASPATGLLVYNLGSAGLSAGYYFWNGSSWFTLAYANGAGMEYGFVRYTGSDSGPLNTNDAIHFDASAQGNMVWNNYRFTLTANKTYMLEAFLEIYNTTNPCAGIFQIYNYTNNTVLINGLYMSQNGGGTNNPGANGPMRYIVTPSTNIEVGIRMNSFWGPNPGVVGSTNIVGSTGAPGQSYFSVYQIGTTPVISNWNVSGSDTYTASGNVGIGTASPAAKLDVNGTGNFANDVTIYGALAETRKSAFVSRNTALTFDNIQIRCVDNGGGANQWQLATVTSGTSATYRLSWLYVSTSAGGSDNLTPITASNSWSALPGAYSNADDMAIYYLRDATYNHVYRVTCITGPSYLNNSISIEKLL